MQTNHSTQFFCLLKFKLIAKLEIIPDFICYPIILVSTKLLVPGEIDIPQIEEKKEEEEEQDIDEETQKICFKFINFIVEMCRFVFYRIERIGH